MDFDFGSSGLSVLSCCQLINFTTKHFAVEEFCSSIRFDRSFAKLAAVDLLIIDDFGLKPLKGTHKSKRCQIRNNDLIAVDYDLTPFFLRARSRILKNFHDLTL